MEPESTNKRGIEKKAVWLSDLVDGSRCWIAMKPSFLMAE
jgi:hypothetical protein